MKKIAVIILNWNGEDLLRKFLPSVCAHTNANIADVIVVDNGSDDNSVEVLKQEFPQVKTLLFPQNHSTLARTSVGICGGQPRCSGLSTQNQVIKEA